MNKIIENFKIEDNAKEDIYISDAIINTIDLSFFTFHRNIQINRCLINNLKIHSSWFNNGFELNSCIIKNKVQYEMGGHNALPIKIKNNLFCDIFIFFDCHFNKLILENNIFQEGCTILGNEMNNTFEDEIEISNNIGNMYMNQID